MENNGPKKGSGILSWDDDLDWETLGNDPWEEDYLENLEADAYLFGEVPYEIWRDCYGYPGYQISNKGRVWSEKLHRCLNINIGSHGYPCVNLYDEHGNHRSVCIHRLIGEHFRPRPAGRKKAKARIVRHLNDDKLDFRPENLEWGSYAENMKDAKRNGIRHSEKCILIRNIKTGEERWFPSVAEACKFIGINKTGLTTLNKSGKRIHKGYEVMALE